jgi:tryptophan-rich sensory protein
MSDLQVDVLSAFFFIGLPVYYLMTGPPYTNGDDYFYMQFADHYPSLFPRGWAKIVFPIAWTLLWPANGVGAYLFWHSYELGNDVTYLVGIIFYIVALMAMFSWNNMFFKRRALKSAFFTSLIFSWGGTLAYMVCAILYSQTYPAIAAGLLLGWLTYANILMLVAAFVFPAHLRKHEAEAEELEAEEEKRRRRRYEPHHQTWEEIDANAQQRQGPAAVAATTAATNVQAAISVSPAFRAASHGVQQRQSPAVIASSLAVPRSSSKVPQ